MIQNRGNRWLSVEERFWLYVSPEPNSGCWLWIGHDNHKGYGRISVNGRLKQAHRVAYEMHKGAIPVGLHIDHLCKITCCVNPDHLEAVLPAENTRRGKSGEFISQWNRAKTHCPAGHQYNRQNTFLNSRGHRCCRLCHRQADQRYRDRQRQARAALAKHGGEKKG